MTFPIINLVRHEPMSSWLAKPLAGTAVAIAVAPATKDTAPMAWTGAPDMIHRQDSGPSWALIGSDMFECVKKKVQLCTT